MWPFRQIEPELVTVSLTPQAINLCWITKEKNNTHTKAYKTILFKNLEFEKSTIFNLSKISATIKHFVSSNNIRKPLLALAVSGPNIIEKVITLSTSNPSDTDFNLPQQHNLQTQHSYLGPSIHNGFDFYVCGIKRDALFQYNLLAIKAGLTPISITTQTAAHLQLYRQIKGNTFRQSQLTLDLARNNNDILHALDLKQIVQAYNIPDLIQSKCKNDYTDIATNIGLFLIGNET